MAPRLYTVYTTISLLSQEGILPSLDYIGLEWFQINRIWGTVDFPYRSSS